MLLDIPNILTPDEAKLIREKLLTANWVDGRATAGSQSRHVKHNQQLDERDPFAFQLGQEIIQKLTQNPTFMSAALPNRFYPPLFNQYTGGGEYGMHIDGSILFNLHNKERVRTDVSGTLFLTDPDTYEGGELIIEDTYGQRSIKLPAGHLVLYPSTSLHKVNPVTKGARISCFFWLQSLVREDSQRAMLYELDQSIQALTDVTPGHPRLVSLAGVYHNLLRRWSNT